MRNNILTFLLGVSIILCFALSPSIPIQPKPKKIYSKVCRTDDMPDIISEYHKLGYVIGYIVPGATYDYDSLIVMYKY